MKNYPHIIDTVFKFEKVVKNNLNYQTVFLFHLQFPGKKIHFTETYQTLAIDCESVGCSTSAGESIQKKSLSDILFHRDAEDVSFYVTSNLCVHLMINLFFLRISLHHSQVLLEMARRQRETNNKQVENLVLCKSS